MAACSDITLARWSFLRPWWRILHVGDLTIAPQYRHGSLQLAIKALRLRPPSTTPSSAAEETWIQQRDALEIVLLASVVNLSVVRYMAERHCGTVDLDSERVTWHDIHPDENLPSCVDIDFSGVKAPSKGQLRKIAFGAMPWEERLLELLLTPVSAAKRSLDFRLAKQAVLARIPWEDISMRHACEHFRIQVNCILQDSQVESCLLGKLASWKRMGVQNDNLPSWSYDRYAFRVGVINFACVHNIESGVIEIIKKCAREGSLELGDINYCGDQVPTCEASGKLITTLVNQVDDSAQCPSCSKRFDVLNEPFNCTSALMYSEGIDEVVVHDSFDLLWASQVFFSGTSAHRVKRLQLKNVVIDEGVIHQLQRYRRSTNPAALIHPTRQWGRINLSESLQLLPTQLDGEGVFVRFKKFELRHSGMQLHKSRLLDVTAECDLYIHVLLPGYGVCRVDRNEGIATKRHVQRETIASLDKHHVKSLTLDLRRGLRSRLHQYHDVRALFQLIGRPLEHLSLHLNPIDADEDECLMSLFTSCPDLMTICVTRLSLRSFESVVRAYRSGICTLRSLELRLVSVEDLTSLARFIVEVSDPTSAMARCLEELSLSFLNPRQPSKNDLEGFLRMLASNQSLRYLSLQVLDVHYELFSENFASYDSTLMRRARKRSEGDIQHRYAFLSAVSIAPTPAIAKLDTQVISIIFEFSAKPVIRSVLLHKVSTT